MLDIVIYCRVDIMQCGFVPMGVLLQTIIEAGTGIHVLLSGMCYRKVFGHIYI